jgi:ubiquinol-cytochrome c reductase cytochrome b subunit/menaquinol-cytochrome c reductase cytochrome b/c subunit
VIGDNGNNGPGPVLTHIGSLRPPQAIASTLVNPTPPMPSFRGLAQKSPQKFQQLVGFLSLLQ